MKFDIKNKKTRLLLALVAGAATILVAVNAYQQPTTAVIRNITTIDFHAFPEHREIELSKGDTLTVPIRIESPKDAEYTLSLSVVPGYSPDGSRVNRTMDELLRDGISVGLSGESVTLSLQDPLITDLGLGLVERDSGIALTISAAPDAVEGTYSYALEARRESADGRTLGTSAFFTVTVK